ncbi:MAG: phage minor capsid protein [Microbacteriaceae bacterium]
MPIFVPAPDGLSPDDLIDELGVLLSTTYEYAETELLADASKRAYRILELEKALADSLDVADRLAQQRALRALAEERAKAIKELREHSEKVVQHLRSENLAESLVTIAAQSGSVAAVKQLELLKRVPISTGFSQTSVSAVVALQMDLNNRLEILNQRILRFPQDVYQRVLAENAPALVLGIDTGLVNQKRIVQRFLNQGVTNFVDKSNRAWRIGSYSEMASRTAAQRAWSDASVHRMQQSGLNLVTPVVGFDGCKYCHEWAGKVLSTDGRPAGEYMLPHMSQDSMVKVVVAATLEHARSQGFQHPNCRCTLQAFLPGVTPLQVSTYNPEAEKAREKQRELEREIRAAKRDAATAPDEATRRKAQAEIAQKQAEMRAHLKATGRTRDAYREQLHFADGGTLNPRGKGYPSPRPVPPEPKELLAPQIPNFDGETAKEIGEQLQRHLASQNVQVLNFRGDADTAREYARAISEMSAKYGTGILNTVEIRAISNPGVMAHATAKGNRVTGEISDGKITMATRYATSRETLKTAVSEAGTLGHFRIISEVDPGYYVIVHEYGHLLDYSTGMKLQKDYWNIAAETAKQEKVATSGEEFRTWLNSQRSGYGKTNTAEGIAEAFADVEINGTNATALSKAVHKALLLLLGKQ